MTQQNNGNHHEKRFYYGIIGLTADSNEIIINDDLVFRKVANGGELALDPPRNINPQLASSLVLWPPYITHEIELNVITGENEHEGALLYSNKLATLLRISGDLEFLMPLYSEISWKTFKQADVNSANIGSINSEQSNDPIMAGNQLSKITRTNLQWVNENYDNFGNLFEASKDPQRVFNIFNSINRYHLESEFSMSLLRLFIPFDMLFGEFRSGSGLALLTSSYLFESGDKRFDAYNEIRNCYSIRNSIIHGYEKPPRENELKNAIQTMRHHLGMVLKRIIEEGKLPTEAQLRSLLLRG